MNIKVISKEPVIIAVLIAGLLCLYSLDRSRLGHSVPDEKRYIQSTKEMAETGDYITPRYHGRLRFQKPILFYWLVALSYRFFGVGIYGARFPSIAAALLNIILAYLLGRSLFGKKAGIFSALALSTCEVFFIYARFATPDMPFFLFIAAAIYLFLKAYKHEIKGRFRYLYMYVFMALAMLTKGPLGFIYPMAAISLFLIFKKDPASFKEINFLSGILVFAAISAPWFVAMILLHGEEYLRPVWSLEIAKKLKYFSSGPDGNILVYYFRTALYYMGMIFARHLPWSLFLPASFVSCVDIVLGRRKKDSDFTFIGSWFFAVFISLVLLWSKESYYVLALSMPLSLFIGAYLSKLTEENALSRSVLFKLPFMLTIVASVLALLLWLGFTVYILDKPILSFSLLAFVVPLVMARAYFRQNKILLPLSYFMAAALFFGYFAGCIIPAVDEGSLLSVADEIKTVIRPGDVAGVASDEISYHRLNIPLENYMVIRADKRSINERSKDQPKSTKGYINNFLSTKERRVFCVITKKDYFEFVDKKLINRLFIMDKRFIWKKFSKQDKEYFKRLLSHLFKGEKGLLKEALKEEIYLVSNYNTVTP